VSSISYAAAFQDEIALLLTGGLYAACTTEQKTLIDGNSTASPPTRGAAKGAWDKAVLTDYWVQRVAAGSTAPDLDARRWFIWEAVKQAGVQMRPNMLDVYTKNAAEAEAQYVEQAARLAIDASPASSTEPWAVNQQNIRLYCLAHLIRRTPRVLAPVETIDAATYAVLAELWDGFDWPFRRRLVTMAITTSETVTFSVGTNTQSIDRPATREFYYGPDDEEESCLKWADGDDFAQRRAANDGDTGQPRWWRFQSAGDTLTHYFVPIPDAAYELTGEIYITGPGNPSSATDTTPFARFPASVQPLIRELVLARVLKEMRADGGREEWEKEWARATEMCLRLADQGRQDDVQVVRDEARDFLEYDGVGGMLGGPL